MTKQRTSGDEVARRGGGGTDYISLAVEVAVKYIKTKGIPVEVATSHGHERDNTRGAYRKLERVVPGFFPRP